MSHANKFLTYVYPPTAIVEMRVMATDGEILSGRYTELAQMAALAADMDTWPEIGAIYFTINSISPERAKRIGAWQANLLKSSARSTRDADVARRDLYLIDIDPNRPSGVCSTNEEKAAALEVADRVRSSLTERGWPEPIIVDSGNGYHLYYKGDGCNPDSKAWVHVLKYLASMFDSAGAKVDISVGNASRISRLPGTLNRKGPNSPERPHRRARVISYPDKWEPVSHGAMIYRLASEGGYDQPKTGQKSSQASDTPELLIDDEGVHALIAEYPEQLRYSHTVERGGLKMYVLSECPFAGRRHGGDPNKTSLVLSDTAFGFKCLSDDCAGLGWQALKKHLHAATGRWPQTKVYDNSENAEQAFNRWLALHRREQERLFALRPDWQYDNQTWQMLESGAVDRMEIGTDAAEWGLTFEDVWRPYVDWAVQRRREIADEPDRKQFDKSSADVIMSEDTAAIGAALGKDALFLIVRSWGALKPLDTRKDEKVYKYCGPVRKPVDELLAWFMVWSKLKGHEWPPLYEPLSTSGLS